MTEELINLAMLSLLGYRIAQLIIDDYIFEGVRNILSVGPWTEYLLSCYWCVGLWLAVTLGWSHIAPLPPPPLTMGTLSVAIPLLKYAIDWVEDRASHV